MAIIRPVEKKDLLVVRQLALEIWPVAYGDILSPRQLAYMLQMMYSPDSLENQFSVLQHSFVLLWEGDIPLGFASFSPHKDTDIYHLHKLYVLRGEHGKHYGESIISYIFKEIKSQGGKAIQLNVNRNNNAIGFYKKFGFEIISEEDNDIGEGFFMNDYVMEKKI